MSSLTTQFPRDSDAQLKAGAGLCLHCAFPVPASRVNAFCCHGCEAVYSLLHEGDLDLYYSLRRGPGNPVIDRPDPARDFEWLGEAHQDDSTEAQKHLHLDIQGLHCSGCVWVLEKTFNRHPGALKLITNPALGKIDMWVSSEFPLQRWLRAVEAFGYRFGPSLKTSDTRSSGLLLRVGICISIALNVMLLSASIYLGLDQGPLYKLFRTLSYGLASLSVFVGGPVFFRSALAGLRNRVLHLDVPISLGIVLAFAGSSWSFWTGRDQALYLDSVSVFIALMLLGRYMQERVLNANRNRLLASQGCDGLRSKRLIGTRITTIGSTEILLGDHLLIAPGDLVPVPATLSSPQAHVSTDWINGESRSVAIAENAAVAAGSFNAGNTAFHIIAEADFNASPLQRLLSPDTQSEQGAHETGLLQIVSSYYVIGVLLAAFGGFVAWLLLGGDVAYATEIATAVLVVSCPCAFGIATPLAHEIVLSKLRKSGLYVRSGDFLHRLSEVTTVVFDKTGTLSTGQLSLANPRALVALPSEEQQILYTLAAQSSHPVSAAITHALETSNPVALLGDICVTEIPGQGLECRSGAHLYQLGKASWATSTSPEIQNCEGRAASGTVFCRDGKVIVRPQVTEEARSDARDEVAALRREGFEVYLLSGDSGERVAAFSREMGLPATHALAQQSPEDKQRWLSERDHGDILFIGDGINDSLAAQMASCSGTPALDRPFMASHCDFYLGTSQIFPIREALHASKALLKVVKRNIAFALTYNIGAISLAWAGLMRPWLAAILMPSSSILVVLATTLSLRSLSLRTTPRNPARNTLWKS